MSKAVTRKSSDKVEQTAQQLYQKLHGRDEARNFYSQNSAMIEAWLSIAREWIGRENLITSLANKNRDLRKKLKGTYVQEGIARAA